MPPSPFTGQFLRKAEILGLVSLKLFGSCKKAAKTSHQVYKETVLYQEQEYLSEHETTRCGLEVEFCGLWCGVQYTATKTPLIYSEKRNRAASVQSQFLHSCDCKRFIYSRDCSTYFPAAEQADYRHMNVETGTEAAQFLFWEYLFQQIFGIVSLQCRMRQRGCHLYL
jgi:hypothetical protein